MTSTVRMYALSNEQPDGVDLPDDNSTYRNQFLLEDFLHKNCPVHLDWSNSKMEFLVLIETSKSKTEGTIVGMCALVPHGKKSGKMHLCVIAIVDRLQRKGLGTQMLKQIAMMHPRQEVTLSVPFEHPHLINFYCSKGYAKMTSVDEKNRCFVLSLANLKLLGDVKLPDD